MSTFDLLKEWEIPIIEAHAKYEIGKETDVFDDVKKFKTYLFF